MQINFHEENEDSDQTTRMSEDTFSHIAGPNVQESRLHESTTGRCRPVSYPDRPITAHCRFINNATQLAFYINLHRAVIGPSATLTGR